MGTVPPRLLLPRPPRLYALYIDESERYGSMCYHSSQEAQAVCNALQSVYDRVYYGCRFSVRERDVVSETLPAFDRRLIRISEV